MKSIEFLHFNQDQIKLSMLSINEVFVQCLFYSRYMPFNVDDVKKILINFCIQAYI